jgi:threonylcarbamoyladenosine tRNA methylthiotransferase MtaB
VPHFHIPLQVGNNRLLKAMRRKYDCELYADRVRHIKRLNPSTCIGVDVIVGFPGETDDDFMDTINFIKDLDVSYLHVFTYSERARTTAIKLEDSVPLNIRRNRSKQLHILSEKKKRAFYEKNLGTSVSVLFEAEENNSMMHGFSENYIKVKTKYNQELVNTIQEVELEAIDSDGIMKCLIAAPAIL